MAAQNVDLFDAYFRRADLDKDGRISGSEGVAFFQGSNLPKQVLAQIWMHADQNKTGFLGRNEFYNALKLVTVAQSKRELTPDMVKAALYGPASTKIPAPQITFAAQPSLQSNSPVGHHIAPSQPTLQSNSPGGQHIAPSHGVAPKNVGLGGTNGPPNVNMGQQFFPSQQTQSAKPPRPMHIPANFHPQQASITPSHPPTSHSSSDWLGGVANVPSAGVSSPNPNQVGFGPLVTGLQPTPQPTNMLTQAGVTKRDSPIMASPLEVGKDPRPLLASGNGFMPGPVFGDASSTSFSQPKQEFTVPASFVGASTNSSNNIPVSTVSQLAIKSGGVGSPQDSFTQQYGGSQYQQTTGKGNPQVPSLPSTAAKTSTSYGFAAGAGNVTASQQAPWPKITQSDVQKYTRVFVAVDTDRDGKISGEQARNLFLSWRLPREVLKQVWDLSDQDNDSMLSIREFFIALYLMERYREGRPLPSIFPSGVLLDEGLLPATGQFASSQNSTSSKHNPPGVQQPRVMPAPHQSTHADRARVPNQGPLPLPDESKPPSPQKSKVPVLEKNLIDQLSEGEKNSLNSKFKEATEANKKVEELEKEIVEARQKIEFYSSKMQELVLYKSRCDSRFNEITERVSADKREVESLAKKYEEKYKQRGDVASKLTIEESTFRDIQEEKMNLYRAIVKIDQSGKPDAIQVEADRIKLELEELMKSLNDRCKTYSLRSKPTTLVELPFGWQLGIQEGAADWDESWDKFEDEGFTIVKELSVDVQNVVAPPKEKILRKKQSYVIDETEVSSPVANGINIKKVASSDEKVSNDAHSEDGITSSPNGSPLSRNASEGPSKQSHTSHHNLDNQSEHGGIDSVTSGEKGFDEPKWGNFDTHYDTDSLWDFNSGSNKEMDNAFFDSGDLGLPPIRTDFSYNENKNIPKKSSYAFNDSGSSPQSDTSFHNNKSSFVFDSVPSTPQSDFYQNKTTFHFDSVPSSPQINNNLFENKTTFQFDSVPSSPQINNNLFENKTAFQFDSVPSTPMYGFGDTSEGGGRNLDSFSRFDSFNTNETGQFQAHDSFSRFDSFRSTADSEYGQGFFAQQDSLGRFDSFRSSSEDGQQRDYGRFDSIRSNRDSYGFSSFDDSSDPFGSGPFKTDSQTPRRDANTWKPF